MLEYVRRLLLAQTRLAAQFDTVPQPEIREVTLQMEKKEQNSPEEDAPGQEKRPGLMQAGAEMDGTETWSAEQALREMTRQTMRLESMQLQKSAQAQLEQTRRLEAAMTELTQRQRVDITARTPDSAAGGTKIEAVEMPPVQQFVVQTGTTCYQALAGFCRHSADIFPRFLADGTLVLRKNALGKQVWLGDEILQAQYVRNRYGVAARQVLINTRNGSMQAADYAEFQKLGGTRVQYAGMTGNKIRASFRTAKQRLDDAKRDEKLLYVTAPGVFLAEPLDMVSVKLDALGISGTFTVQEAQSGCDETGATCTLILR